MNEDVIVTSYVVTGDSLKAFGRYSHVLASLSDAEVLWVAIIATMYFQNHHERTLFVLKAMGYLSNSLSVSLQSAVAPIGGLVVGHPDGAG